MKYYSLKGKVKYYSFLLPDDADIIHMKFRNDRRLKAIELKCHCSISMKRSNIQFHQDYMHFEVNYDEKLGNHNGFLNLFQKLTKNSKRIHLSLSETKDNTVDNEKPVKNGNQLPSLNTKTEIAKNTNANPRNKIKNYGENSFIFWKLHDEIFSEISHYILFQIRQNLFFQKFAHHLSSHENETLFPNIVSSEGDNSENSSLCIDSPDMDSLFEARIPTDINRNDYSLNEKFKTSASSKQVRMNLLKRPRGNYLKRFLLLENLETIYNDIMSDLFNKECPGSYSRDFSLFENLLLDSQFAHTLPEINADKILLNLSKHSSLKVKKKVEYYSSFISKDTNN